MAEAARVRPRQRSAHDLSDGGLAQALVESCLRRGVGARIALPDEFTAARCRSSTCSASRPAGRWSRCRAATTRRSSALCAEHGVPCDRRSASPTRPVARWTYAGSSRLGLDELRAAFESTLPRLFGEVVGRRVGRPAVLPSAEPAPAAQVAPVGRVHGSGRRHAGPASRRPATGGDRTHQRRTEAPAAHQAAAEEPATEAPAVPVPTDRD